MTDHDGFDFHRRPNGDIDLRVVTPRDGLTYRRVRYTAAEWAQIQAELTVQIAAVKAAA